MLPKLFNHDLVVMGCVCAKLESLVDLPPTNMAVILSSLLSFWQILGGVMCTIISSSIKSSFRSISIARGIQGEVRQSFFCSLRVR